MASEKHCFFNCYSYYHNETTKAPRTTWGRENGEISLDLMHEAAVGHLSQGHHSIIIGSNAAIVNEVGGFICIYLSIYLSIYLFVCLSLIHKMNHQMVYRLSQLSLPQYHHRHHPLTNPHQPFSPDLHIQGLYKVRDYDYRGIAVIIIIIIIIIIIVMIIINNWHRTQLPLLITCSF